jgi:hypothetical protein
MACRLLLALVLFAVSVVPAHGEVPRLTETGVLVTEAASRSRLGGDGFYVGDLLYVQVVCPPNTGETSVSAHMEYKTSAGEWVPVPTSHDEIGQAYTSERYPGLRDYVSLRGVTQRTQRNISLFMPYDATDMPKGTYLRRYVIRLWNSDNQDVARTVLPTQKVTVASQAGRTIIKEVECKACCSLLSKSEGPLEPIPETVPSGAIHFFNSRTGKWTCPGKLEAQPE